MNAPLPTLPRIVIPLEVYYFDTDAAGVVNNIAYLRMVEIARSQLATTLGWSLADMGRTGLGPARLGDPILISAELTALEKVRMHISFEITSATEPKVIFIRCVQTMVTVQLPGGRPQRVPTAWSEAYPQLAIDANRV